MSDRHPDWKHEWLHTDDPTAAFGVWVDARWPHPVENTLLLAAQAYANDPEVPRDMQTPTVRLSHTSPSFLMSDRTEVAPAALEMLRNRVRNGEREYGEVLTTHNGRDASQDALEEAADLFLYLMQERLETTLEERIDALPDRHNTGELIIHRRRTGYVVTYTSDLRVEGATLREAVDKMHERLDENDA